MTLDHLSPRARLVAEQDIAARVDYLRKTPVLPLKPLDDIAVWMGKEIAGETPQHKPITILLIPCGMGASGMVQRVIASYPPHPHRGHRKVCSLSNAKEEHLANLTCFFSSAPLSRVAEVQWALV